MRENLDIRKASKVLKYLLYFAELTLFYVLQNIPSGFPLIFSVKPLLIISLLVTVSLLESEMTTVFFSLAAGLLMDASFSQLGLGSLFLTVSCTFLSALSKKKFHVRVLSNTVATFAIALLYSLFIFISAYLLPGYDRAFVIFIDRIIPSVLYTVLISPLVYILNLYIFRAFRNK